MDPIAGGLNARVGLGLGALDLDVDLEAGSGEVVAVLGPNGAGKTTLLRALAGLVPLRAGRVTLDGAVLEDSDGGIRLPPEERPIGVVFQDLLLFPHLSVLDNVAFGLRARGASKARATREAATWLERIGLAGRGGDRPARLSGGEAQRVALARALATEPALLLLDEPLAAVDAEARGRLRAELRRSLAEFDGARVLVTHDLLDAAVLADRVVVLEGGRVAQTGTVPELAAHPRSPYVAALVGSNLLHGRGDGSPIIRLDGGGSLLVVDGAPRGVVFVTFRPSAVSLYTSRPSGTPRNVWEATVADLDGIAERVRVRLDGPVPAVAEVTAAAVAELGLAPGGRIWASLKATDIAVAPG